MRIIIADENVNDIAVLASIVKKLYPNAKIKEFTNEAEVIAYCKTAKADVAFLDTSFKFMLGTILAQKLKEKNSKLNVIFVTNSNLYREEAFDIHASGYVVKPATEENIKKELEDLRYPVETEKELVRAITFGNFDAYTMDGGPIRFARSKAKELFAYLVYRRGASVTAKEIAGILFEDAPYDNKTQVYLQKIVSTMMQGLREAGIEEIVNKDYNALAIDVSKIKCDYYDVLNGKKAIGYTGEFMCQYEWAEDVNYYLSEQM